LHWEGERLVIREIEARWRVPDGRCFRVRTEDERVFELTYLERDDVWRLRLL
jgi:hypothetical protein